MTTTTMVRRRSRGRLPQAAAVVLVGLAGALLAAMAWSVVEVAWFVETSAYCAETTCTGTAMGEAGMGGLAGGPIEASSDVVNELLLGEDAFLAAGGSRLAITFGYLPMTILALMAVVALLGLSAGAWVWSQGSWTVPPRDDAGRWPVRVAWASALAITGFVLLYAVNHQAMAWFTYVVE